MLLQSVKISYKDKLTRMKMTLNFAVALISVLGLRIVSRTKKIKKFDQARVCLMGNVVAISEHLERLRAEGVMKSRSKQLFSQLKGKMVFC